MSKTIFHALYEKVSWSLGLMALTLVLTGSLPVKSPSVLTTADLHLQVTVPKKNFFKLSAADVLSHAKAWRQYTGLALATTKMGACMEPKRDTSAAEALPLH